MKVPLYCLALAVLLVTCFGCHGTEPAADGPPASPPAAVPEPTADADEPVTAESLMHQVADFYKAKQTIRMEEEAVARTRVAGLENEVTVKRSLVFARPNRLALRSDAGPGGIDVLSDGETLTIYVSMLNAYAAQDAPPSCDELLADPTIDMISNGGLFVLSLLGTDPYARMMDDVVDARYLGLEPFGETQAHRLSFTAPKLSWELWVDSGTDPLVHQVVLDISQSMTEMLELGGQQGLEGLEVTVTEQYRNWAFDQEVEPDNFVFSPPPEAQRQDDLFAVTPGEPPQRERQSQAPELIGQPAPQVELNLLDGTTVNLEKHLGEHLVLLDFWATWCPPCREAMPVLDDLAQQYADRGLVVYAVNQGEAVEPIVAFLEEHDLQLTVALDPERQVGSAFGIRGLPTLVVIDQSGVVQGFHVGFAPALKDSLTEELEALLER